MLSGDKTLRAVCHYDPALDLTERERLDYAEKRPDSSTLKALPGAKPTTYRIRPISKAMMRHIESDHGDR